MTFNFTIEVKQQIRFGSKLVCKMYDKGDEIEKKKTINVFVDYSAGTQHNEAVYIPLENMWHF